MSEEIMGCSFAELRHWYFQKLEPDQRRAFLALFGVPAHVELTLNMEHRLLEAAWNTRAHDGDGEPTETMIAAGAKAFCENEILNPHKMAALVWKAMRNASHDGDGWRDIESAPKDGTEILVCVTYNLGAEEDGYETKTWVDWVKEPYVWPHYRERIDIPFPPTHWRPLPAPPQSTLDDGTAK